MSTANKYNKLNLFNNIFKFLFLAFWIIFWFVGIILTDNKFNKLSSSLFIIYTSLCITYIVTYIAYMNYTKIYEDKIEIFYKLVTLISFIFSSYTYYMFSVSIFGFLLKLIFLIIYMYISIIKVHKYKLEEGVVGIIASILMIFMLLRY
ncbi:hypothetical protein H8891_08085 [Paeniclostridium sp. NSJ-45]|uniref:Uncharacterized protein n=2 Tax=Paeniclostridium hominis TaxID=2764329 RepID=A0ABR7K3S9_9FIRM|nr:MULTISPECIES: hypothetical protein [Paeniclostridium]MBC6003759.1 hypothetical protein [Paeniclostridium hominis]